MKQIELSGKGKGKFFIVDNDKFKELSKYNWFLSPNGYIRAHPLEGGDANLIKNKISLHRFIMKCPKNLQVDHINRNKLDNRRVNLRICTMSQNQANRSGVNRTSKYKGVSWNKSGKRINRWKASIQKKFIGNFRTERQAALAYDLWANYIYGSFAKLNFERIR